jgi:hypothetical protein
MVKCNAAQYSPEKNVPPGVYCSVKEFMMAAPEEVPLISIPGCTAGFSGVFGA